MGEVVFFTAKHWGHRNRANLTKSMTQEVDSYGVWNPLRLTILPSKSEDYTTAPKYLLSKAKHVSKFYKKIPIYTYFGLPTKLYSAVKISMLKKT